MSRKPVISIVHVSKSFRMKGARASTLKAAVLGWMRRSPIPPFQALNQVSFEVFEGETVGLIGSNGSGKSTILKLITGIIRPNTGTVRVHGRISPLIEAGTGFHAELTGRENIFLNGALLGVPRSVLEAAYDDIVAFAEIGAFIEQPVKTYSSGMYTRLACAIAIHVDPDILVMDEVLAVGDEAFQEKCLARVRQLRAAGKTILLVAHNRQTIASICDRVIWLDRGVLRMDGEASAVLAAYFAPAADAPAATSPALASVSVDALVCTDADGQPRVVVAGGEAVFLRFSWRASGDASVSWLAMITRLVDGCVVSSLQSPVVAVQGGDCGDAMLETVIPPLAAGEYAFALCVHGEGCSVTHAERRVVFRVEGEWRGPGLSPMDGQWSWVAPLVAMETP